MAAEPSKFCQALRAAMLILVNAPGTGARKEKNAKQKMMVKESEALRKKGLRIRIILLTVDRCLYKKACLATEMWYVISLRHSCHLSIDYSTYCQTNLGDRYP